MENHEKRFQLEVNDYIKIEIIGYVKTTTDSICGMHRHPFWELIYTKEGEGIHQFGEQEVTLGKDEICLIPPEVLHDCRNEKPTDNVKLYIGFSYNYSLCSDRLKGKPYISGSIAHMDGIREQIRALCDLLEKDGLAMEEIDMGSIISMVSQMVKSFSVENVSSRNVQDIRIQNLVAKVKEYLQDNLCRSIKLEELGAMFYLSPHYIGDSFKKVTGMSMKKYHDMLRMRYAFQLLEETELSISEISDRLGFDSIHYFSRRFKERYGFSPSVLRKK